jgi:hypothetical protein
MHRWLLLAPSEPKPPSGFENLSLQSSAALLILGSFLVIPKSERMRSIQFVERYLGR